MNLSLLTNTDGELVCAHARNCRVGDGCLEVLWLWHHLDVHVAIDQGLTRLTVNVRDRDLNSVVSLILDVVERELRAGGVANPRATCLDTVSQELIDVTLLLPTDNDGRTKVVIVAIEAIVGSRHGERSGLVEDGHNHGVGHWLTATTELAYNGVCIDVRGTRGHVLKPYLTAALDRLL